MGLLDDAIRQHLELKRQHGATDEELRKQETEALGPARRDFSTADEAAPEPATPLPSDDAAGDYEPERAAEPAGWLDEDEAEPLEHAAEAARPPIAEQPLPAPDPVPVARSVDSPTEPFDALKPDAEDDEGDEPAGDAEDVLEETPDFLQDTPEHDRLWFEQKPPRDFDFDG